MKLFLETQSHGTDYRGINFRSLISYAKKLLVIEIKYINFLIFLGEKEAKKEEVSRTLIFFCTMPAWL